MDFSSLGLSLSILDAIKKAKYESPYPIQIEAIPAILKGKDILGIAPTGSGKTAAYVLPILQQLQQTEYIKTRNIPVLILVPTRELATQVEEVIKVFSNFLPRKIKTMAVFGGVSANPQMRNLFGTEVVVATPGRLLDLVDKNSISLSAVKVLVLDEADKILNLGFKEEVDEILSKLPKKRQNILFSATMEETVEELINRILHNPEKIFVEVEGIAPELIAQSAYLVPMEYKGPLLRHLIKSGDWNQVLVFTSSIRTADNVAGKLNKNGIEAVSFHGDKSQGARTDALTKFKNGKLRVLVATDLASRGIDIKFLPFVVNYELPRSPKDYIHRIGRTGRAGAEGEAISLISEEEEHHFKVIQKKMGRRVELIDAKNIDF
ncbi:DEAD/DEAH box helicase [Aquiflexum gelatinilyticum]|uniref:DEAD/DEAH box helicase n=1 Tax=Aquiflexum gelatinilyticum TaxID=2961943 RepID=A0A9X2P3Y1_9BACT|nr:DEAD/DEAH box helicase [Aquiflexum gelatinilyticum]MCR9015491.1 DEAD/DEAH box helicase [Aquiflexum gelatinilyticum]